MAAPKGRHAKGNRGGHGVSLNDRPAGRGRWPAWRSDRPLPRTTSVPQSSLSAMERIAVVPRVLVRMLVDKREDALAELDGMLARPGH